MVFRWATILLLTGTGISASAATQPSWSSLLVALGRGYQPGLEELPQVATALADAPREVLIAWDRQDRFLFYAVGDRHNVWIGRSLVRQLQDSILIHNHPSGYPPSPRDLDTVLRYGLRRLYVVARIDGVVSLTDVSRGDALQWSRRGGLPVSRADWRPVAATTASIPISRRRLGKAIHSPTVCSTPLPLPPPAAGRRLGERPAALLRGSHATMTVDRTPDRKGDMMGCTGVLRGSG